MIRFKKGIQKLIFLWFSFVGISVVILIFQFLGGAIGVENFGQIGAWFTSVFLPGLLCLLVLKSNRYGSEQTKSGWEFSVSYYATLIYLIAVVSVLFLHPFSSVSQIETMEAILPLNLSLQGILIATWIGIFHKFSLRALVKHIREYLT